MRHPLHKKTKIARKKASPSIRRLLSSRRVQVASIVLIALIGTAILAISRAASFSVSVEPESGTITSCAKQVTDATASGGKAVSFGCTAPTGNFVHPGVFVDKADLDFVKGKIAANQEPWKSALNRASTSGGTVVTPRRNYTQQFASLNYVPMPVTSVQCPGDKGIKTLNTDGSQKYPQVGCFEQTDDALAAYTQAVLWYYTGNEAYAKKSIEIMNAWSNTLQEIKFDQPRFPDTNGQVYENGKLQAGWSAENLTRAAEIIRYTYKTPTTGGWSTADITKMENMLKNVHLPLVIDGFTGGANWLMTFADATMGIGVFTNNKATFDSGVAYWRAKVPTTIYLKTDGAQPVSPHAMFSAPADMLRYWKNPSSYINGLQGETCRDLGHTMMGMGAMAAGAETANIQGIDLYNEQKDRLIAGYELQSAYVNAYIDAGSPGANVVRPANWVCPNPINPLEPGLRLGYEAAYNHYAVKKGVSMPQTKKLVERLRPSGPGLQNSWETLIKANTP